MRLLIIIFSFLSFFFFSCDNEDNSEEVFFYEFPDHFPEPIIPEDNKLTESRIKLGERLFFDPILSRDSTISCATCHKPELAFADNKPTTPGIENRPGTRNVPSILNVVYQARLLREGSVPTIEGQVLVPIQEHNEFDSEWPAVLDKLNNKQEYLDLLFEANYISPTTNDRMEYFEPYAVTRAIASYERTLISADSKYDNYLKGNYDFTEAERLGYNLFMSDSLNCSSCHSGVLFTNMRFYSNGIYQEYSDPGRFRLTNLESDKGVFKVPSLRNVTITPPYMFDGSFDTLKDVILHYSTGGKDHINKSDKIKSFQLKQEEIDAIIAFLETLSDH